MRIRNVCFKMYGRIRSKRDNLFVWSHGYCSRVAGFDRESRVFFVGRGYISRVINFLPGISTCDSILSVKIFFKKNINSTKIIQVARKSVICTFVKLK